MMVLIDHDMMMKIHMMAVMAMHPTTLMRLLIRLVRLMLQLLKISSGCGDYDDDGVCELCVCYA